MRYSRNWLFGLGKDCTVSVRQCQLYLFSVMDLCPTRPLSNCRTVLPSQTLNCQDVTTKQTWISRFVGDGGARRQIKAASCPASCFITLSQERSITVRLSAPFTHFFSFYFISTLLHREAQITLIRFSLLTSFHTLLLPFCSLHAE